MTPRKILFCFGLILFLYTCEKDKSLNGSFQLSVSTDTSSAAIGDLIKFRIQTKFLGDNYLVIPQTQFNEPLGLRKLEPLYNENGKITGIDYILSVWDTGIVVIPAIALNVYKPDSTLDFVINTDSLEINVVSMVAKTGSQSMRPIKGPVPVSSRWPTTTIILVLLLAGILCGLYIIYGKRIPFEHIEVETVQSSKPADEMALEKLIHLKDSTYLQSGEIKQFYVQLSYILREYVENSVYIKTLEMTTEEIKQYRSAIPFDHDQLGKWMDILQRADLSKYAKSDPEKMICHEDLAAGKTFVINTAPSWKIQNT
jgi:hypothetical protein